MAEQPYSRVNHAQLGECNIQPSFPGNRAGLYASVVGRRLARLVEQADISTELLPFVKTTTEPVKVYATSVKGVLGGLPVEAYLRECKDLVDGGTYYALLVVGVYVDGKRVTIEMFPDGQKGLGLKSYTVSKMPMKEKKETGHNRNRNTQRSHTAY